MTASKPGNKQAALKTKSKGRTPPKKTPGKRGGGRPSDYHSDYCDEAMKLCMLFGATDVQLAEYFEVSEVTINAWKKKDAEFLESIRSGKVFADAKVANSLYNRAIGTTVEECCETVCSDGQIIALKTKKQLPGDVQAQRFWLKNRQPDKWTENIALTDNEGNVFQLIIHEQLKPRT